MNQMIYVCGKQQPGLVHSNRKGTHWGKHIFGDWDKRATYADGQDDPNAKQKTISETEKPSTYTSKNIKEASSKELQDALQRSNLEKQYLAAFEKKSRVKELGEKFINRVIDNTVNGAADKVSKAILTKGEDTLKSLLGREPSARNANNQNQNQSQSQNRNRGNNTAAVRTSDQQAIRNELHNREIRSAPGRSRVDDRRGSAQARQQRRQMRNMRRASRR